MENNLKIISLKAREILPYLKDIATLRITVFKEFPYLYEGDFEYESNYLKTYLESAESSFALVFDKSKVVGATTCIPLEFESEEFKKPFKDLDMSVEDIYYFGESVLLPSYRGRGLYSTFFNIREDAARQYGSRYACFCVVDREKHDPRKPADYIFLNSFWEKIGYIKRPEIFTYYSWKEVGEVTASPKRMTFWIKNL